MNFRQWLFEYEGFNFSQERDLVNGPQYPNSKYKGKGDNEEGSRGPDSPGDFNKATRMYGLKPGDPLLKISKLMKKKQAR